MFCGGGTFSKYYPLSPPWYPYFCPGSVYTGGKIRRDPSRRLIRRFCVSSSPQNAASDLRGKRLSRFPMLRRRRTLRRKDPRMITIKMGTAGEDPLRIDLNKPA